MSYFKIIILIAIYSTQGFSQVLSSEDTHYFDKYIEGIFKTIENPPVECLKLFKESDESKMLTNKDLLMCYTLIENGIPQQLKFDILNHSPTSGTIGVLVSSYVLVLIAILTYNLNFNM